MSQQHRDSFDAFTQMQIHRLVQGHYRYGAPDRRKNYLRRIRLEIRAYTSTGNMEHLLNVANYCWLESQEPANPKFHKDSAVASATRDVHKLGFSKIHIHQRRSE